MIFPILHLALSMEKELLITDNISNCTKNYKLGEYLQDFTYLLQYQASLHLEHRFLDGS
jgi:hypothetical protein